MKLTFTTPSAIACSGLLMLAHVFAPLGRAQSSLPAITLDPPTGWELQSHAFDSNGNAMPAAPANFRRLGQARVGEAAPLHTLVLRFAESVKLTGIKSTPDFRIEQGGSCVEGNMYQAKSTCNLLVRFTPRGPGTRRGEITITHSGSATPLIVGLGGSSSMPVLSFIPSVITTVPASYPSSVGLLNGAQNIAVDGSDTLYIADYGNNAVYKMDSSGTIKTISNPANTVGPWGIVADSFGIATFTEPSQNKMFSIDTTEGQYYITGSGTDRCLSGDPACFLYKESVATPGSISVTAGNALIYEEAKYGAAISQEPYPATFLRLYDQSDYPSVPDLSAFAADAQGNLYTFWNFGTACEIDAQTLDTAETRINGHVKVVGGGSCGFAGDGGLSGNAEISATVGQITFDPGGNMYFTDESNQRVRRVDAATGIIRTIAGYGVAGYTGDRGSALYAELYYPTGVAVDSQGQVYIVSNYAASNSKQLIRKVGPQGYLTFGSLAKGTASAARIVTVTNTGNADMVLTSAFIGGANASDFTIDSHTTSCNLTNFSQWTTGATCTIGVIFTPSAGGSRTATLTMLDNTATNSNTVTLAGTGVLPSATFKITSPTPGQGFPVNSTVTFTVSVSSASGPAPTGTVQFKVDGANYGSPVAVSLNAASINVTSLTSTSHTLSATYSGDLNYAAGGPISVSINIAPPKAYSNVSVSSGVNSSASCAAPQFSARVSSASGPVPTGIVRLLDGNTPIASGSLVNGHVVLSSPALGIGTHTLVASYAGDANHLPANSPALVEVISPRTPCINTLGGAAAR